MGIAAANTGKRERSGTIIGTAPSWCSPYLSSLCVLKHNRNPVRLSAPLNGTACQHYRMSRPCDKRRIIHVDDLASFNFSRIAKFDGQPVSRIVKDPVHQLLVISQEGNLHVYDARTVTEHGERLPQRWRSFHDLLKYLPTRLFSLQLQFGTFAHVCSKSS